MTAYRSNNPTAMNNLLRHLMSVLKVMGVILILLLPMAGLWAVWQYDPNGFMRFTVSYLNVAYLIGFVYIIIRVRKLSEKAENAEIKLRNAEDKAKTLECRIRYLENPSCSMEVYEDYTDLFEHTTPADV
jgi:hypothetical protein